jgi:hypothetical protein
MARWIIVGFVSGFIAVLVFHQGALGVLHWTGIASRAPFSFQPTAPFGVPVVWSIAFWGGVWGAVLAATLARAETASSLLVLSTLFGAIFPTLVAWFVVSQLKGQPMAAGWVPKAMAIGPIVNAAWGLGTGLGLLWFGRPGRVRRDAAS